MTLAAVTPFYDAAREGRLVLAHCPRCGRFELPGTQVCPQCLATELEWRAVSGDGTVFTYVVFHRALHPDFEVPYAVAVVELDEGPHLVASVTGSPLAVGLRVRAVFDTDTAAPVPVRFEPQP